jgi:hypothetical protein
MTQSAFIEFLTSNDCEVWREGNFYRCIRKSDRRLRSMMPAKNQGHSLRALSMCNICQDLGLIAPPEIEFADGILKQIKEQIKSNFDKNSN